MPTFILVKNLDRPIAAPARVRICDTFSSRLRGFMFRPSPDLGDGLLLQMDSESRLDSSIHMLFVPFDLAVFWINSRMQVVDRVLARSWRPAYVPAMPARFVLEVHPSRIDEYEPGQKVEFVDA
jgi:uncharacterized membrane protein (UPF0127 family)